MTQSEDFAGRRFVERVRASEPEAIAEMVRGQSPADLSRLLARASILHAPRISRRSTGHSCDGCRWSGGGSTCLAHAGRTDYAASPRRESRGDRCYFNAGGAGFLAGPAGLDHSCRDRRHHRRRSSTFSRRCTLAAGEGHRPIVDRGPASGRHDRRSRPCARRRSRLT